MTTARKPVAIGERGYERIPFDEYRTPPAITNVLFENIFFPPGKILEPAAGAGDMAQAIRALGFECVTSDIRTGLGNDFEGLNFIGTLPPWPEAARCRHIVSNPPFSLAEQFIQRGLEMIKASRGTMAYLLPYDYDTAIVTRGYLFEPPFCAQLVIGERIRWLGLPTHDEDGHPKPNGRANHAWFVWRAGWEIFPIKIYRKFAMKSPGAHEPARD